jgi:tight adherence protein B
MTGSWLPAVTFAAAVLAWPVRRVRRPVRPGSVGSPQVGRIAGGAAELVSRWRARSPGRARGAGDPRAVERAVLGLVEGLAAALRAGLTPSQALAHLAGSAAGPRQPVERRAPDPLDGLVERLAAQAGSGALLEPVLRTTAVRLGSPALLAASAGWAMAERHGAPIVDVLDGLVSALRDAARSAAAVETALAAPRATAALLGVLPLGGVVLGELVGVDPIRVLAGTPPGRAALVLGLALTWAGRVWMRRLVRAVERG